MADVCPHGFPTGEMLSLFSALWTGRAVTVRVRAVDQGRKCSKSDATVSVGMLREYVQSLAGVLQCRSALETCSMKVIASLSASALLSVSALAAHAAPKTTSTDLLPNRYAVRSEGTSLKGSNTPGGLALLAASLTSAAAVLRLRAKA